MYYRHAEDNATRDTPISSQRTVVEFSAGAHTAAASTAEWPWGLLLSDKHHVLCPSDRQRITVGRSPECDIVVEDPRVSAVHFALIRSIEVRVPPSGGQGHMHHRTRLRQLHELSDPAMAPRASPSSCASTQLHNDVAGEVTGTPHHSVAEVKVYLEDLSSNGTYVNDTIVGRGRCCQLQSGDDIGVMALPSKISRAEVDANGLQRVRDVASAIPVSEVALLANLPQSRSYVERFCFQAYQPHDIGAAHGPVERRQQKKTKRLSPCGDLALLQRSTLAPHRPLRWQKGSPIGRGASSVVYAVIDVYTGRMYAMKVFRRANGSSTSRRASPEMCSGSSWQSEARSRELLSSVDCPQELNDGTHGCIAEVDESLRELYFLTYLVHHRIVQCVGVQRIPEGVCIILEYVAGGTLRDLIRNFGAFDERVIRLYTLQVLQGMDYLQGRGVVHGDLKCANVLMSERGSLKITDFGTSRFVQTTYASEINEGNRQWGLGSRSSHGAEKTLCGTPIYMSPELIKSQESTFASDVWALGCMVYEMAMGVPPWEELHGLPPHTVVWSIGRAMEGPSLARLRQHGASPALLNFLECTLHIDHHQRPSVAELLKHPFISGQTPLSWSTPRSMFPSTPPNWGQGASPPMLQMQPVRKMVCGNCEGGDENAVSHEAEGNHSFNDMMVLGGDSSDLQQQQQLDPHSLPFPSGRLSSLDLGAPMMVAALPQSEGMSKDRKTVSPTPHATGVEDHKAFVYGLCRKKIMATEDAGEALESLRKGLGANTQGNRCFQKLSLNDAACLHRRRISNNNSSSSDGAESGNAIRRGADSADGTMQLGDYSVTADFSGLTQLFND
ncbi:putative protein kinase [Trypanosoma grayi]|uniref:putative protein kinase n=1 Tax=Trypanosoma grayi TaxID=71804 RepID=UPI0004F45474|nr:putative protein kinase [Trypanosoma grayi]KEG10585.1 putative protein kinase [Trypanosoma grayi]